MDVVHWRDSPFLLYSPCTVWPDWMGSGMTAFARPHAGTGKRCPRQFQQEMQTRRLIPLPESRTLQRALLTLSQGQMREAGNEQ